MSEAQLNISERLQKEARRDRIKIAIGAVVLTMMLLAGTVLFYVFVQNRVLALGLIVALTLALVTLTVILNFGILKKMEHDSFGEGMHLIMESVPMACTMMDVNGKVIYCNDEAPKMFGAQDKGEYIAKINADFMPEFQPDGTRSRVKMEENMKVALAEGASSFDFFQNNSVGKSFPMRNSMVSAFFEGEEHLVLFSRDRTKSVEIQKKEKIFHEKMKGILDASPLICVISDDSGHVTEVNKAVERIFGIPDRKIFVDHFTEFMPKYQPDGKLTLEKLSEVSEEAIKNGFAQHEWMYQLRDGTPLPVEETMRSLVIDGKNFNVTYIRDLRKFMKNKERDELMQHNVQVMAEQLSGHVTEQSAAVTESAASIEEMIANIQSVTNALSKNSVHVDELQSASEVGHTGLNKVAEDIREIASESESLLEINSVMQNIASQTNLLSMNAAIEAAHAGESGRGFAVVADEIRKLAESSSSQSKTISSVLKNIKDAIDKITKSIENVQKKFDAIESGIKTVAEQEGGALNAMEEQRQGSTQILQAMGQLSDITYRVKEEAQQMVKKQQEAMLFGKSA